MCAFRKYDPMTPTELRQALRDSGKTQAALARALGLDPSAVSRILRGQRELKVREVERIHAFLDQPGGTAFIAPEQPEASGEGVPVLGHGRGGRDGFFFDNGAVVDRLERPASLRNVPDVYAVYMYGTSQEPRIRHGELCFVHPYQPPGTGDDVVVQLVNDEGYIKTYVRQSEEKLVCSQYNPLREIEWPADEVRAVHRIVWIARTIR